MASKENNIINPTLSSLMESQANAKPAFQSIMSFTTLATQIAEICGKNRLPDYGAVFKPFSGSEWMKSLEKMGNLASTSKWFVDLSKMKPILPSIHKPLFGTSLSTLYTLEEQTSQMAKDLGIQNFTSVASQISAINDLFSPKTAGIKELIAPTRMLDDLKVLATKTHQSIVDAGGLSAWQLGLLDSASFMVDRQIGWASQFYTSVFDEEVLSEMVEWDFQPASVNTISLLPEDLEDEKKKKQDITTEEALELSTVYRLAEKGKRIINKIVDINNMCERSGHKPLFKYTGAALNTAASMGGTVCTSKESFGIIVDGLYFLFYENLERIKGLVTDAAVRNEDVYQCIFRVKDMRTDIRHDYEHGPESSIRKKTMEIGKSYSHYTGKPVLTSKADFLRTQEMMYDEFDSVINHLQGMLVR